MVKENYGGQAKKKLNRIFSNRHRITLDHYDKHVIQKMGLEITGLPQKRAHGKEITRTNPLTGRYYHGMIVIISITKYYNHAKRA